MLYNSIGLFSMLYDITVINTMLHDIQHYLMSCYHIALFDTMVFISMLIDHRLCVSINDINRLAPWSNG